MHFANRRSQRHRGRDASDGSCRPGDVVVVGGDGVAVVAGFRGCCSVGCVTRSCSSSPSADRLRTQIGSEISSMIFGQLILCPIPL